MTVKNLTLSLEELFQYSFKLPFLNAVHCESNTQIKPSDQYQTIHGQTGMRLISLMNHCRESLSASGDFISHSQTNLQ